MRVIKCTKVYACSWITAVIMYLLYVEIYLYKQNGKDWPQLKCNHDTKCVKLLLVADPQIIGKYGEPISFLTPISMLDSDIYLKKTYLQVYNHINPDVVIFLGDLMDEGSRASNDEFKQYTERIYNIFIDANRFQSKYIWLPGDNDIGGEEFDLVTPQKVKRFIHVFSRQNVVIYKNVTFCKINRLTHEAPTFMGKRVFEDTAKIFIGLSHIPLLHQASPFVDQVMNRLLPHVLFTAHEHRSMIIKSEAFVRTNQEILLISQEKNNDVHEFRLGQNYIYEFIVPTCSYRMGTDNIGYAYAVLENNNLRYTVLWSPSRFSQLKGYLNFMLLFLCSSILFIITVSCKKRIKIPLLHT